MTLIFHSCPTTIHHLYSHYKHRVSSDKHCLVLVFLDFHKAFDTVNHQLLLTKHSEAGVTGSFLSIIQSFLSNHCQSVRISNSLSNALLIHPNTPWRDTRLDIIPNAVSNLHKRPLSSFTQYSPGLCRWHILPQACSAYDQWAWLNPSCFLFSFFLFINHTNC